LNPAIESMIETRDEVRFVYVLGDDFDGYSAAASWEDTKLGIGHLSKWQRIAVVTNHDSLRHAVGMFGWMVPGHVKVFPLQDQTAAIEWAAG
jgi:stage II sporulation SpoAA-like protein